MKTKHIFIALIILALAGASGYFGWHYWKNRASTTSDTPKSGNGIEYYHCGMHPWIKSDKPGKCPICGMDLTPVYKGGQDSTEGIVQVDPAMIQNLGVKTEVVSKKQLTHTIRTTGRVDYDETKQAYITVKFSGYIEKLYVDYEGKLVQKGSPLFEIYSPDLVAAQQEYLQAIQFRKNMGDISSTTNADMLVQSARKKLSYWDISSQQIKQIEQSGEVKKSLTIYSPFSGYVIEKNITEGIQVQAGMNLLKIADLSRIWVFADVYETELSLVSKGDSAKVELPYEAGEILTGTVSYIYPYMQEQTRTAKLRIDFANPKVALKKDMYVTVNIMPSVSMEAIAIPEQAVIHSGTRDIVVLTAGEGKYKSIQVKLGTLADGWYEVKEGLNEGDTIVTSSQFLIDSESNLKSGMSSMPEMNMKKEKQPEKIENGKKKEMIMSTASQPRPKEAIDPVCGMTVSTDTDLKYSYNGTTYYFCAASEMDDFKLNPEKYVGKK